MVLSGFSDQILRFIAERSDESQVDYVDRIDEVKRLGEFDDTAQKADEDNSFSFAYVMRKK